MPWRRLLFTVRGHPHAGRSAPPSLSRRAARAAPGVRTCILCDRWSHTAATALCKSRCGWCNSSVWRACCATKPRSRPWHPASQCCLPTRRGPQPRQCWARTSCVHGCASRALLGTSSWWQSRRVPAAAAWASGRCRTYLRAMRCAAYPRQPFCRGGPPASRTSWKTRALLAGLDSPSPACMRRPRRARPGAPLA